MDSPDWRTRDAATIGLARDRKIVVERVTRRLDRHGLSLEQRLRLLRALETRLLLLPRGALGIRMRSEIVEFRNQNGEQIRGVEITELLPGMPAEEHLRVGDIIMSIGGERLDVASEVSSLIKQHWPGEVIELEIARDQPADHAGLPRRSTRLHLSMKLGSTAELDNHERGPGIQADRKHQLERTVRHYFSQYGPAPRPLSPPGDPVGVAPGSGSVLAFDVMIVRQELLSDRDAMLDPAIPGLTRGQFRSKWKARVQELTLLLDTNDFDDRSRRLYQRLREEIILELEHN